MLAHERAHALLCALHRYAVSDTDVSVSIGHYYSRMAADEWSGNTVGSTDADAVMFAPVRSSLTLERIIALMLAQVRTIIPFS